MAEPWVVGIEIGGTKLQLGLGDGQGRLSFLERLRVDPSKGAAGILDQIRTSFPTLLEKAGLPREEIAAAGIGFGGPVDAARGVIQRSYQIPGWQSFALASWIKANLCIPVAALENDADIAGLAESRFGAGVGYSPLLYMTVGSGIGGALIIDQKIYRGAGQGAAELGHLRVPDIAAPGQCMLELEQVASGWAIAEAAQRAAASMIQVARSTWSVPTSADGRPRPITAALIAEAAAAGDPLSAAILDRSRQAIAFALVQAITMFAPRRIVIGGGVSLIGELNWFDPIRTLVDRDVFAPFKGHFDIVPAGLGESVVVYGALAAARDTLLRQ